jgi:aryl-alcohol dehydrogenase-like predicted oxidoreductase
MAPFLSCQINIGPSCRYSKENFPKINHFVDKLSEIGRKHNANAGQVTVAWILAQGDDFVVIPGTKKIKVGPSFSLLEY